MNTLTLQQHLNNIVEICEDGRQGYGVAAEKLEHTELQTLFNRLSQQRKLFVEEIKEDARNMGVEIDDTGSAIGFFHRTWLAAKATFASSTVDAVIEASLTGEKKAMEVYNNTISEEIPEYINDRLKSQLHSIKIAIHQLNSVRIEA
jgi:uncharacterized protein (TIGR02284 family)